MIQWWYALTLAQQIFATIGIAATVVLLIQIVLMLVGAAGGAGDGADAALDGADAGGVDMPDVELGDGGFDFGDGADLEPADGMPDLPEAADVADGGTRATGGLRLFTLQGLVSFAAIFGWGGLVLLRVGVPTILAALAACALGLLAMLLMAVLMRAMARLQEDGTFNIKSCFGHTATVYLPIYPKRTAPGKVSVQLTDRYLELAAVTDVDHKLETGATVTVVGFADDNTLVVID